MRRFFFWVVCIVGLFFLGGLAILPHVLSTPSGKNWLVGRINQKIQGTLSLDKLSLHWWGGQSMEGFALKDEGGKDIASFHTFSSSSSLFSFLFAPLFNSYHLGKAVLDKPHLFLVKREDGEFNLDHALSHKGKKISIQKKKAQESFPSLSGDLLILQGEVFLSAPKIEPITITDLNLEFNKGRDVFNLSGKTKQGLVEGEILVRGTFQDHLHLVINAYQLPIAIFDQWCETCLFSEALGATLTLQVDVLKTDQSISLTTNIQATNLNGSFKGSTEEGRFILDPGGEAVFTMTPAFFKEAIAKSAADKWYLASKSELVMKVDKLEFPLALTRMKWKDVLFAGHFSLERAEIVHSELGNFSLNHFVASLNTEEALHLTYEGHIQSKATTLLQGEITLDNQGKITSHADWKGFPVDLFQLFSKESAYLSKVIGPTFDFTLDGSYDHGNLQAMTTLSSLQAKLQGSITGQLDDLVMDFTGDLLYSQRYSGFFGPPPVLILHAEGAWENNTFAVPLIDATLQNEYWKVDITGKAGEKGVPFQLDLLNLVAVGTVRDLPVKEDAVINDGEVSVYIDGSKNRIQAHALLETTLQGQTETRSLEAEVDAHHFITDGKLDLKNAEISIKGNLNDFPVIFLNAFVGENIHLPTFFGQAIDLVFQGTYFPGQGHKTTLDLDINGKDFQGMLSIALDETLTVTQLKPAFFHWEFTPTRYQALMQLIRPGYEPNYVLTRGAAVDLTIHQFNCPASLPPTTAGFFCQSGFTGNVKVGPLHFKSRRTPEEIALLDVTGTIQGKNFSQAIQLSAKGKIVSPTIPKNEQSGFSFAGEMLGFWSSEGHFNRQGKIQGELSLDLLPVKEFTEVLPIDEESRQIIQAVLGPLVNARIFGEISRLNGPLTVDIKSSNLKAILPIWLEDNRVTLQKAVEVELTLTEPVNALIFKDINPLFITGAWSDHPIKVFIDAEGFSLPFEPFTLRGVQIETAVIDLGKVRVRNGGQIQLLMNFLKAKEVSSEGVMEAWFTPIFLTLKDGIASYKRCDMLLGGNIHIALWGKIDLNRDKVRMTLGIASETIEERFNVHGLSRREMFQVKMRGSTSKLELDWSAATTRIGIIIAKSAAGGLGQIVGGIIEQFIGNLGEEETPPPTTYPFPWGR